MKGWCKRRQGAKYGGVGERTFSKWLRQGLKYSRLPTGTILVSYEAIDEFLRSYEVDDNRVSTIVEEVMEKIK
jgi:hypothetical protein